MENEVWREISAVMLWFLQICLDIVSASMEDELRIPIVDIPNSHVRNSVRFSHSALVIPLIHRYVPIRPQDVQDRFSSSTR